MSRHILFRGKTRKGEWVYGDLIQATEDKACLIAYIDNKYKCNYRDVFPETVGQFTGLTDKKGNKIFEGDIISSITLDTNTERLAVIGFGKFIDENNGDEYLGFYIEFDGCKTTITQLEMEEVRDRFEVIGNIYDNKELLGEQNEYSIYRS